MRIPYPRARRPRARPPARGGTVTGRGGGLQGGERARHGQARAGRLGQGHLHGRPEDQPEHARRGPGHRRRPAARRALGRRRRQPGCAAGRAGRARQQQPARAVWHPRVRRAGGRAAAGQAADVARALGGHAADQGGRAGRHRVPHVRRGGPGAAPPPPRACLPMHGLLKYTVGV